MNTDMYDFTYYYASAFCKDFVNYDNRRPHYTLILTPFYDSCKLSLQNHRALFDNTPPTLYYKTLLKQEGTNITNQIKRLTDISTIPDIFKTLHSTKKTTNYQKQLTYRLIFGMTPTTQGKAKQYNRPFNCKFCNSKQETEEHIFFECKIIYKLKLELIRLLRQPHNTFHDIYKSIFLNTFTKQTKQLNELRIVTLALYRETIWTARLQAQHHNITYTQDTICTLFQTKLRYHMHKMYTFDELENLFE